MKKYFFILNLILISSSHANCFIHFFNKIIYTGDKKDLKIAEVIKKTSCPKNITQKFYQTVISSSGTLRSKYLSEIDENIELSPLYFQLIPLGDILKNKLNMLPEWKLTQIKFMNGLKALSLNEGDDLILNSEFKTGSVVLPLKVVRKNQSSDTLYIQAFGTKQIELLIASTDISSDVAELSEGLFKKSKRHVENPELYFKDLKTLPFYRPNRHLRNGQALKKSNLIKKNLVTFGSPAKITFKKGNLILNGVGIPTQSGKFGDLVKLKQPNNKKIFFGKVNGLNSVSVGL